MVNITIACFILSMVLIACDKKVSISTGIMQFVKGAMWGFVIFYGIKYVPIVLLYVFAIIKIIIEELQ